MKYFIGIVPPESIYLTLLQIQQQFGDNRLEPHITLIPPVSLVDVAGWQAAARNTCNNHNTFNVALPRTGNFGKRVLFVDVDSAQLHTIQMNLATAIRPFEKAEPASDHRPYKPHLTLGRSWCGFTPRDFAAMKAIAEEYLSQQPVVFEVTFLRIYHKPGHVKRYQVLEDIPLVNQQTEAG